MKATHFYASPFASKNLIASSIIAMAITTIFWCMPEKFYALLKCVNVLLRIAFFALCVSAAMGSELVRYDRYFSVRVLLGVGVLLAGVLISGANDVHLSRWGVAWMLVFNFAAGVFLISAVQCMRQRLLSCIDPLAHVP